MQLWNRIYRYISVVNSVIHALLVLFIIIVGFLPFREGKNFYRCFAGFFGSALGVVHPIILILLLAGAGVLAFLAVKRPVLSVFVVALTAAFFVLVIFAFSFEGSMIAILTFFGEADMPQHQIGLRLLCYASYVVYFDIAVAVYSFVTVFVRSLKTI